jgi:ribosomal protein S4
MRPGPIRPWRRGNRKVKHRPGLKNKRKPKNKHEHDLRNKLSSKLKLKFIPIQFTVLVTTAIAALKAISKTTSNIITSTAISLIALTALTSSTGTTTTKPISPLPS